MKEEELEGLRRLEFEASTAPWVAYTNERDGNWYVSRRPGDVTGKKFYIFRMEAGDDAPDARFIAAIRNAAPSLISELRSARTRLRGVVAEAWSVLGGGDDPRERCRECGAGGYGCLRELLREACPDLATGNADASPPPDSVSESLREARRLLGLAARVIGGHTIGKDARFDLLRRLDAASGERSDRERSSPSSPSDPETPREGTK